MESSASQMILAPARIVRMLAEKLLTGIDPAAFARKPPNVEMNHPAWVYGHIALPIDLAARLAGVSDLPPLPENWTALFSREHPAQDDPNGIVYPPMHEITSICLQRMDAALKSLEGAPNDDALRRGNTTFMSEIFPTIGALLNGSLNTHAVMHLGQVSAWRRVMGLGPCL